MSEKLMRWTMKAAESQEMTVTSPHAHQARLHRGALAIQQTAEPILAVVRACEDVRYVNNEVGHEVFCVVCKQPWGECGDYCPVPAALEAMAVEAETT